MDGANEVYLFAVWFLEEDGAGILIVGCGGCVAFLGVGSAVVEGAEGVWFDVHFELMFGGVIDEFGNWCWRGIW